MVIGTEIIIMRMLMIIMAHGGGELTAAGDQKSVNNLIICNSSLRIINKQGE